MRMRRRHGEEHENLERWLITYADLITLLLAFFIMMYTFSKQDAQKYQEVANHLKVIFAGGSGIAGKGSNVLAAGQGFADTNIRKEIASGMSEVAAKDSLEESQSSKENNIRKELENELLAIGANGQTQVGVSIVSEDDNIVVRGTDKAFFDAGSADLRESAKRTLDRLVPIIKKANTYVRVEGHTDDTPITTSAYRSNWELSSKRATEVVRYLVESHRFPPERLSAASYAQYRPIAPNKTPESRAQNRRTEIVLIKAKQGSVQ
jgi:chemotaxis protein MotB